MVFKEYIHHFPQPLEMNSMFWHESQTDLFYITFFLFVGYLGRMCFNLLSAGLGIHLLELKVKLNIILKFDL